MTSKHKNIGLIIGFILVLILCYQFAIKNTFEQKRLYKTLQAQELLFKNTPKQLNLLNQKERYYDSLLQKYQLNGSSIQNNLLKTINSYAEVNKLKVISFLEPHITIHNDLNIKTYDFTLEGDYNAINQFIYELEQHTKFGEIIHLEFNKKKYYKTNRNYLQARVLLKSFS